MKRFLFLVCGASLLLIAGGRFLVFLGNYALSPNSYHATAQIQFAPDAPLPPVTDGFLGNSLSALAKSQKFVEQLACEKYPGGKMTEAEAISLLQDSTTVEQDTAQHAILLTYFGPDPENTVSVAQAIARAWVSDHSPEAKILPPQSAHVIHHPFTTFVMSSQVFISLMAALAGTVILLFGWRLPPTMLETSQRAIVVQPKF